MIFDYEETTAQRALRKRRERMRLARARATHTKAQWLEMVTAYDSTCLRCGAVGWVERDHVVPIYQGGDDSIQNIQPLCARCNCQKGPETVDHRIGHPATKPEWIPAA